MSTAAAKATCDALFENWDKYKAELMTNPDAKYLEYVTNTPVTKPALGGFGAPQIPGMAVPGAAVPGAAVPGVAVPVAPSVPGVAVPGVAVPGQTPVANSAPNPNEVFGDGTVTI